MEEAISSRKLAIGSTLKVPSVRDLGKQELVNVPRRYIRDDLEKTSSSISLPQVPVIDMEKLLPIGDDNSELRGFILLVKNGDFFREIMEEHNKEFKSLAIRILCQLAKVLRMDEKELRDLSNDGMQLIRINYYPPCPEPEKTIGISPHSDADALTILLQLNETEGLQVRKDGIWVPVKPLPNAFIVNVGDMMEILSNGVYRSIEHRAVVNSKEERLSLATFYIFNPDSELGPAHSLIGPNNPPIFGRIRVGKYLQDFFARKLDGKSFIDRMKVETKDDIS